MDSWLCYCLKSCDSNKTYIGVTNSLRARLDAHNRLRGESRGAFATRGETWYPVFCMVGFHSKQACLSFEWFMKRALRLKSIKTHVQLGNTIKELHLSRTSAFHRRILSLVVLLKWKSYIQETKLMDMPKWWCDKLKLVWLERTMYPDSLESHVDIPVLFLDHPDISLYTCLDC